MSANCKICRRVKKGKEILPSCVMWLSALLYRFFWADNYANLVGVVVVRNNLLTFSHYCLKWTLKSLINRKKKTQWQWDSVQSDTEAFMLVTAYDSICCELIQLRSHVLSLVFRVEEDTYTWWDYTETWWKSLHCSTSSFHSDTLFCSITGDAKSNNLTRMVESFQTIIRGALDNTLNESWIMWSTDLGLGCVSIERQ